MVRKPSQHSLVPSSSSACPCPCTPSPTCPCTRCTHREVPSGGGRLQHKTVRYLFLGGADTHFDQFNFFQGGGGPWAYGMHQCSALQMCTHLSLQRIMYSFVGAQLQMWMGMCVSRWCCGGYICPKLLSKIPADKKTNRSSFLKYIVPPFISSNSQNPHTCHSRVSLLARTHVRCACLCSERKPPPQHLQAFAAAISPAKGAGAGPVYA